ncbi:DUF4271 domain-containing protein [Alkalitalea saponilacus]|uniref:DUF4271 domain-containing protein n=1 Tax=Alkalitalea saponilacus TaxID=889453 RepID=A0A1T5E3C1_9BACT|nr:DUF4271 domain-containing protein [Alkalitalea saponilacus]ASB49119.1 hypothetical protein CDL62_08185 [Alkalitalea saponilacus]SKB78213.1 protein of unknown function [Alkalitalea saponilacus]
MDLEEQHTEFTRDTVQVQVEIPQPRLSPGLNIPVPTLESFRTRIQLLEPDTIREPAPPPPPRRVAPPPSLSQSDSVHFNLIEHPETAVNWQFDFNTEGWTEESSESLFSKEYLQREISIQADSLMGHPTHETGLDHDDTNLVTQTYTEFDASSDEVLIEEKSLLQNDWFISVVVFSVVVLGYVRLSWSRYIKDLLHTIIYPSFITRLSSANASNFWPSFLLGFLFYLNSTLFIFQILTIMEKPIWGYSGPILLPFIFIFLFLLFTSKVIVYRLVGKIFGTSNAVHGYLASSSATAKSFSILIMPFVLFLPYLDFSFQEIFIRIGLGVFIFLYLMQIVRGIRENFSNLLSGYYIILYLCALEILPLSILFKVLFK